MKKKMLLNSKLCFVCFVLWYIYSSGQKYRDTQFLTPICILCKICTCFVFDNTEYLIVILLFVVLHGHLQQSRQNILFKTIYLLIKVTNEIINCFCHNQNGIIVYVSNINHAWIEIQSFLLLIQKVSIYQRCAIFGCCKYGASLKLSKRQEYFHIPTDLNIL